MSKWVVACLALVAGACTESRTRVCGALTCSEVSVCSPDGETCVLPQQVDDCVGKGDGDACSYQGVPDGVCVSAVCKPPGCGNQRVDDGEQCDDGNRVSFDGCSRDCLSDETCGNGIVDPAGGELCDCGTGTPTDPSCTMANSDMPGATCRSDCKLSRCGDGILDPFEQCDDGNTTPGDGCRADCAGRWTVMASNSFDELTAIWGASKTDVFAVGPGGVILLYDGAWTRMVTAVPPIDYSDVWGADGTVYAVGYDPSNNGSRIDRYQNGLWTVFHSFGNGLHASAIHGRSPTDFWVAGTNTVGPALLLRRYSGGTFPSSNTHTCVGVTALNSLWADPGSARVWGANDNGAVCTYSGTGVAWTTNTQLGLDVEQIWGASGTEIYGANDDSTTLVWKSTDGTTWVGEPNTSTIVAARGIGGVAGDVVVVGDQGRALSRDATGWKLSPTPTPFDLKDVWGAEAGTVFIVGENGTILH